VSGAPPPLRWQQRWLTVGWIVVVLVVMFSLIPQIGPKISLRDIDKYEHVAAFAFLMGWFGGLTSRSLHLLIAIGLLALGGAIEWAQSTTPYRASTLSDLIADVGGIVLGWILARTLAPRAFASAERLFGR